MTVFDFVILAVILLSALVSLARGFVRETLSLAAWVLAFLAAYWLSGDLAPHFTPLADPEVRYWAAAITLFLLTLLVMGIVNYVIGNYLLSAGLSGTDRILGVVLGVARGIVVVAVLILAMQFADGRMIELNSFDWWLHSRLVPEFGELTDWLLNAVGDATESWRQRAAQAPPP